MLTRPSLGWVAPESRGRAPHRGTRTAIAGSVLRLPRRRAPQPAGDGVTRAARAAASPWAGSIAAVLRASRPWQCPHHRLRRIGRAQHACLDCGVGVVETGL